MKFSAPAAFLATALSLALLAGCGDDDDGVSEPDSPDPVPANIAPTITSAPAIEVAENSTGVVHTVTASDADGDTLTYAIGGSDAAQFTIDVATGEISVNGTLDFERPSDADGNGIYDLELSASDGTDTVSQDFTLTLTDEDDAASQRYVARIFTSVDTTRNIEFVPGLFMDVFEPQGDTATDRPVMLLASGGGFVLQSRATVERIARDFAARGYVSATMDYRVLQRFARSEAELAVAGTAATQDMFAAVRFLRNSAGADNPYGIDGTTILVGGESAGAIMSLTAAAIDPDDTIGNTAVADYLDANGGVYGTVGANPDQSSVVQGALVLSGAILDLDLIDAGTAPVYAAHEEFDNVVPCEAASEGASQTGLVVAGACAFIPALDAAEVANDFLFVEGSTGHVGYSEAQREVIYAEAAQLFFDEVVRSR